MKILIFIVLCGLLSGCAIADEPRAIDGAIPPLAITPIMLTLTYEGVCEEEPFLLETWIGTSLSARERLMGMWDALEDADSSQVLEFIERLVVMRQGISRMVAPDCTAQAHAILMALIDTTLGDFQMVYNGEVFDIGLRRDEAGVRLTQLGVMLESLLGTLEAITDFE